MTKSSTTELTPTVEHTAEAPTVMTVDGKPLQKTRKRKRTPVTENASSGQARPRQTSRERPRVATDRSKRAVATAEQFQGAGAHVLFGT